MVSLSSLRAESKIDCLMFENLWMTNTKRIDYIKPIFIEF